MKNLKLKLEDLAVESFATGDAERQRGTVHGHSGFPDCDTYYLKMTCGATCVGSCGAASCLCNSEGHTCISWCPSYTMGPERYCQSMFEPGCPNHTAACPY